MNEVAKRPNRSQTGKLSDCTTVLQVLDHPDMRRKVAEAVPQVVTANRMITVFRQATSNTPNLAKVAPMSLAGSMMTCAALGLEPNTPLGHAYLIPFKKRIKNSIGDWFEIYECNLILGYRGLIDLARRGGSLKAIHADVVYAGDTFEFEYGSKMHLKHRPGMERDKSKPQWAYAHAVLEGGGEAFEVLPWSDIEDIRNASQAYKLALRNKGDQRYGYKYDQTPWVAHFDAMARKTAVRRLMKMLPMSIEMASAIRLDEAGEAGSQNFGNVIDGDFNPVEEAARITDDSVNTDNIEAEEPQKEEAAPKGASDGFLPDPISIKDAMGVELDAEFNTSEGLLAGLVSASNGTWQTKGDFMDFLAHNEEAIECLTEENRKEWDTQEAKIMSTWE